jgi:hypothetical protein
MLSRFENLKSDDKDYMNICESSLYSFHVAGIILYRVSALSILVSTVILNLTTAVHNILCGIVNINLCSVTGFSVYVNSNAVLKYPCVF